MSRNRQAYMPKQIFLISCFVLLSLSMSVLNGFVSVAYISGVVVDEGGRPINNAIVSLQGSSCSTRTNHQGYFRLTVDHTITSTFITAGKFGFYNGAQRFTSDAKGYLIVLKPFSAEDNKSYNWMPSYKTAERSSPKNEKEAKPCEVCHPGVLNEWKQDAHSGSATNKVFLSFFNGTDVAGKQESGPGYKLDFPKSDGNCATCHIPVHALEHPFNADPNRAQGVAREGIFCDFCHKISGVGIDRTGARPGILSLKFQRPAAGNQLFFGPYPDVFPGDDGYHPLYGKSHYCAPCHHGKFWNVLAYSEFQEWLDSSYKTRNIHCQNCHMRSQETMQRFATEETGGILRNPQSIPSHINLGIKDEAFMKAAIELNTHAHVSEDVLEVMVLIKNVNAGHHYPTGNPMRNMILLVEVHGEDGNPLLMVNGERVPVWGGIGSLEHGNYAGLPGKGFAKVLKDARLYPDKRQMHFHYAYPAPHWRPTIVESDNRIPADGADISSYQFKVSESVSGPIFVTVRLIFRRGYKPWLDAKGMETNDMEIAQNRIILR